MMLKRFKPAHSAQPGLSWRTYQKKLHRTSVIKQLANTAVKYSSLLSVLMLIVYGTIAGLGGMACLHKDANKDVTVRNENVLSKKELKTILPKTVPAEFEDTHFEIDINGARCMADTSIDISLQDYLVKRMDRATSRQISIVAMDPSSGRILLMAGYNKTDPSDNPCLNNQFPAASVFKIITSAAAIEQCGFNSTSAMTFNGGKYTLYKSQLKEKNNRYTNRISFQNSFAMSVNPVFGKIGANYLGKETIETYAEAFGFNRDIGFELPLNPSVVSVPDEPFHLAEIACGFNRETTLSPLHGALLSATVINDGNMPEPSLIDRITSGAGDTLYTGRLTPMKRAMASETSGEIRKIMRATIRSGTGKKEFSGYRKDPVLSRLDIGGKTGSINSHKIKDVRYDWFVGFAEDKAGDKKLAISVLVAHEKYIGKRAAYYARTAIREYFKQYFAAKRKKNVSIGQS